MASVQTNWLNEPSPPKRFPENLPAGWRDRLQSETSKAYFQQLSLFLKAEYQRACPIFPSRDRVLRALQLTDYQKVKVVILGQDPYHGDGQATGLCFAVPDALQPKPPSLKNIFKEMKTDIGFTWDGQSSELTGWAEQGVLLLNSVLTVRRKQAFSHQNKGWEIFTDRIVELLNDHPDPLIFILWGASAEKKAQLIKNKKHQMIRSAHPSPLSASRGFFGSKPFSKCNDLLETYAHREAIDWAHINAQ